MEKKELRKYHPINRFLSKRAISVNAFSKMNVVTESTIRSYITREKSILDIPFNVICGLAQLDSEEMDLNATSEELFLYEAEYGLALQGFLPDISEVMNDGK